MRKFIWLFLFQISFVFALQAQSVIRGPYLQKANDSSVTVHWRTDASTQSIVNYGTSLNNLNQSANVQSLSVNHALEINGLAPNTKYYYNIANNNGILVNSASDQYFQTHPVIGTSQPLKFWVLGDCGTGTVNAENVRDAYYGYIGTGHTDGILYLGDNAYNSGTDAEYQGAIFEMYDEKLKNTIAWSCLGNHDGYTADSDSQTGPYYDIFNFPTNGESGGTASGTEAYYSFDYGNVHFISLESYETDRSVGGAMYNWAQSDIQNTTQEWIVAIWHHPPYTKGSHNSDTESNLIQMRENFLPMLEANGVDLVMSGHSHSYERSYYINGHYGSSGTFNSNTMTVGGNGDGDGQLNGNGAYQSVTNDGAVYITAGSSGKITGNGALNHPAMHYSVKELGSCVIEVDGDQMDVKFIRETGAVDDYFTIQKASPITGMDLDNFNSSCGIDNVAGLLELSGITYDYDDQVFYGVEDNTKLHEIALDGTVNNTYTLSGYQDTEGIVYLGNNQFGITEERKREVVIVTITNNTPSTITYNSNNVIAFNDSGQGLNNGFEGLAYDNVNDVLYIGKEGDANIDPAIYKLSNPVSQQGNTINPTVAFTSLPNCTNFDVSGLAWTPAGSLLVITEQCDIIYELDPANGAILSQKTVTGFAFPEAITMVNDNELWVGGESNQLQQFVIPGSTCDDGNANTVNDVYDNNCGCAGTPNNFCPNLNLFVGDSCNDGDPTTINDTVNSNCNCVGTPDPNYCPNLNLYIGDNCNDGDPTTINDTVNSNCNCVGTPDPNYCPNLNLYIGDSCNDGDPNTTNDMVNANCVCIGTVIPGCNGQFPEVEGFENGLGDWTQGIDDDLDWTRDSGGTPSSGTGPSSGSNGSTWYMYIESSSPNFPGKTASLVSECFNVPTTGGADITFDYHMSGTVTDQILEFQVTTDDGTTWTTLWSNVGTDGNVWNNVLVNLDLYVNIDVYFRFFGTTGSSWSGDIAIDNINMFVTDGSDCPNLGLDFGDPCDDMNASTINDVVTVNCVCVGTPVGCNGQFPETEGFESGLGDWTQGTDDDLDWTRDSGGTPSNGTGPSSGSNNSTWYMYIESSSPNFPGKTASLVSECFNVATTGGGEITFDYHMNGTVTDNLLTFQVSTDGGNSWTTLWSNSGSDGDVWNNVLVNLDAYMNTDVYFRFFGTTGSSWSGDMAIDNINMYTTDGTDCPNLGLNIGDACNDNNPLTINDTVNGNCVCIGTPDPNYCTNLGLYIGDSCNDNDPTTINDTVDNNCNCVGTPDPNYCPTLNLYIGDSCNDGDPNTNNDTVNANCVCEGTIDPNYCPNLNLFIGDSCNDGDPNTINDAVNSNCVCVGTPAPGCTGQFPEIEGFENGLGDWTQGTDDDLDWTRDSGGTPSSGTGPSSGSNGSTWYMYIESSSPNFPGKTASLVSECFNVPTTGGADITFDYHMSGTVTDQILEFQATTDDGTTWTTLWSNVGTDGNVWNSVLVNLDLYVNVDVSFRFFGTTGSSWSGDIAIDNINIFVTGGSDCPNLGLDFGDPCDDMNPNTINDAVTVNCECVGTFVGNQIDLSSFNNGCGISTLGVNNLSGIAYSGETNLLYGVLNFPASILEIDLDGNLVRTITLTNFDDTEGIVHIGGNQFAVTEERNRRIVFVTIGSNTTNVNFPGNGFVTFNDSGTGDNFGFEGLAYDASNDVLYIGREGDSDNNNTGTEPKVYELSNPLGQIGNTVNPVEAFTNLPSCNNFDIGGLAFTSAGTLLLMSDNCSTIWELDAASGNELSSKSITGFIQPEGITVLNDNEIWVVGEQDQIAQYVIPGSPCETDCYVGATWDNSCNCTGGSIIDSDGDGECAAVDPDDNDACVPDSNDPLCNNGGTSCTTLLDNDFESGYQGWIDGGSDCRRSINDAAYANSGSYCVRLRDNTSSSRVTSPTLNTTNSDILELSFTYITASMETNEDFWLQISSNNGASWSTVETWVSGTDFQNDVREFVSLQIATPLNTTTKIRFVCDATNNGDRVHIDDILLEKCILTSIAGDGEIDTALNTNDDSEMDLEMLNVETQERERPEDLELVSIYPNPLQKGTELYIEVTQPENIVQLEVINLTGKRLIQKAWDNELTTMNIAVNNLTNGTYLLRIQTKQGIISKKFIVLE